MKLSIVTTLYRSQSYIKDFYNQIVKVAESLSEEFEIIFVNDGSPDKSLDTVLKLKKNDNRIKAIDLSRNFGHHYAITAGLNYSIGKYVYLTDCDLEVSPITLITFFREIQSKKVDVVFGFQEKRKGNFIEKKTGALFWRLINKLSNTNIPINVVTERLMNRKYVESLIKLGDKNLFLAGMMYWTGFEQIGLPVHKTQRKGKSSYSLLKRIKLAVEAITSFSGKPLKMMFYTGFFITLISFLVVLTLIIRKFLFPEEILMGFTSLIASIFFSLGLIISSLGLLGIYISKIYNQTQNRPLYIVKDIYL